MDDSAWEAERRERVRAYLLLVLETTGRDGTTIARQAGIAQTTINRFLNRADWKHIPSPRILAKISDATGIPLPPELGGAKIAANGVMGKRGPRYPVRGNMAGGLDLPVLGHAKAGIEGLFMDNGTPQAYVERPWFMLGINDGYAVYVSDHSLGPIIKHGQLMYVDPTRPVAVDDVCIIQLKDGQAFLKVFRGYKGDNLCAYQTNPPEDLTWPKGDVESVHFALSLMFART